MEVSLTGMSATVAMAILVLPWAGFICLLIKVKLALDEIRDILREGENTVIINNRGNDK